MNAIQLQFQDQTKLTKICALFILFFALTSTAQQIVRVLGANGIEWYSCESACVIIGIGNGNFFVAGTDVERIDAPTDSDTGTDNGESSNGNNNGNSGGSSGGSGSSSGNGGGIYTFRPLGSGSASAGSACPGGTSMHCNAERCVILCHQE